MFRIRPYTVYGKGFSERILLPGIPILTAALPKMYGIAVARQTGSEADSRRQRRHSSVFTNHRVIQGQN